MPVDVAWPLLEIAPTPRLPVTDAPDEGQAVALNLDSDPQFGAGMIRPFQRDVKQDFANVNGAGILDTSVGQILATMSDSPAASGELPWRPEFGSQLYLLRNQLNAGQLGDLARKFVVDAVAQWEPRVRVTGAQIKRFSSPDQQGNNVLSIHVQYSIISDSSGSNEVVARGLETTVTV